MPLISLGGGCWKFGANGTKYCGKDARKKAAKQGRAIEWSKHSKARTKIDSFCQNLLEGINKSIEK